MCELKLRNQALKIKTKGGKNIVVCYLKIIKLKSNIQKSENEILEKRWLTYRYAKWPWNGQMAENESDIQIYLAFEPLDFWINQSGNRKKRLCQLWIFFFFFSKNWFAVQYKLMGRFFFFCLVCFYFEGLCLAVQCEAQPGLSFLCPFVWQTA